MADIELKELTEHYFHLGYTNEVIIEFLLAQHGVKISLATLKRRLQDYGVRRRNDT